jgi:acyl carrier protein
MTEQIILERLRPLVSEVTGARPEEIRPESRLMMDLGAESLDLLDLSFLIEEEFGILIEPNELERRARQRLAGGVYERDGHLTPEALVELRAALPQLDPSRLVPGLRKADLPSLLTVGAFVGIIRRKLDGDGQDA